MVNNKSRSHLSQLLIGLVIVLLGIGLFFLIKKDAPIKAKNTHNNIAVKHNPSTSATAPTKTTSPSSSNSAQGSSTNENGQVTNTLPPSSDWVSSSSGLITVQQPSANSTIQSGTTISGTAKVNTVDYILVDNKTGQISQGSLTVVNGKFSGIMRFTSYSTGGQLQVYSPNPNNGAEENIINIKVTLS